MPKPPQWESDYAAWIRKRDLETNRLIQYPDVVSIIHAWHTRYDLQSNLPMHLLHDAIATCIFCHMHLLPLHAVARCLMPCFYMGKRSTDPEMHMQFHSFMHPCVHVTS